MNRKPQDVSAAMIGRKSKSMTPPFLITFEIFNMNVHNCLVDSNASSNVMPHVVAKRLQAIPDKTETRIMQLDRTNVRVIGELKDVLIWMAAKPQYTQVINIEVVDIPEAYGMLLSRDWSSNLNGYFLTDWSHILWPQRGKSDMLRVDQERYMKYVVTEPNDPNEPVMFYNSILGNYSFDVYATETCFGECHAQIVKDALTNTQLEEIIKHPHNPTDELPCIIVDDRTNFIGNSSFSVTLEFIFGTLHFDDSKCLESVGVGSIFIGPLWNQCLIAIRLDCACTSNTIEHEGLLKGLRRAIEMNIKNLRVFDDPQIMVNHVKKKIHYSPPHLVRYQHELWSLIGNFDSFNVTYIPRKYNHNSNLMVAMAVKLLPNLRLNKNKFHVELIFRSSVTDNISN